MITRRYTDNHFDTQMQDSLIKSRQRLKCLPSSLGASFYILEKQNCLSICRKCCSKIPTVEIGDTAGYLFSRNENLGSLDYCLHCHFLLLVHYHMKESIAKVYNNRFNFLKSTDSEGTAVIVEDHFRRGKKAIDERRHVAREKM